MSYIELLTSHLGPSMLDKEVSEHHRDYIIGFSHSGVYTGGSLGIRSLATTFLRLVFLQFLTQHQTHELTHAMKRIGTPTTRNQNSPGYLRWNVHESSDASPRSYLPLAILSPGVHVGMSMELVRSGRIGINIDLSDAAHVIHQGSCNMTVVSEPVVSALPAPVVVPELQTVATASPLEMERMH